jgi:hypothetical protein
VRTTRGPERGPRHLTTRSNLLQRQASAYTLLSSTSSSTTQLVDVIVSTGCQARSAVAPVPFNVRRR